MINDIHFDWLTSDSHFEHNNIVDFCFRPGYYEKDYDLHNRLMEEAWHMMVQPYQSILHLGDLFFGPDNSKMRDRDLPGIKYLILGNHDRHKRAVYEQLGFTILAPFEQKHGIYRVHYTHYPMRKLAANECNIHGHLHNNSVTGLTKRHKNVSVELYGMQPVPHKEILKGCFYRAKESQIRDFAPDGT